MAVQARSLWEILIRENSITISTNCRYIILLLGCFIFYDKLVIKKEVIKFKRGKCIKSTKNEPFRFFFKMDVSSSACSKLSQKQFSLKWYKIVH